MENDVGVISFVWVVIIFLIIRKQIKIQIALNTDNLFKACEGNDIDGFKRLIDKCLIDVNVKNNWDHTPLQAVESQLNDFKNDSEKNHTTR